MQPDIKTNSRQVVIYWSVLVSMLSLSFYLFWLNHGGHVIRLQAPDGQGMYILSKLMGIICLVLLWWQVVTALLSRTGIVPPAFTAGKCSHIIIGTALTISILMHAGLFMSAVANRTGHLSLTNLVPALTNGYYDAARSLGVIALLLVVLAISMSTFGRRYVRLWRVWHLLVVIAMVLVLMHAYAIGSEIQSLRFQPVFWGIVATFAVAVVIRIMVLFRK
jgi:predicted ferric reductase